MVVVVCFFSQTMSFYKFFVVPIVDIYYLCRLFSILFFYMKKEKFFEYLGWVGMCTAILMYVFYFPQIKQNLAGNKGSFIQPFMAGVNCTLWVFYCLFKEKRDLPVAIANAPGVIFGFLAAFTAL